MKKYTMPSHTGLMVMESTKSLEALDKKLSALRKDFEIREIDITFKEQKLHFRNVRSSRDAYEFIKDVIFEGMEIQEHFVVLFMDQSGAITGFYRHSKGTINSTQVDIQLVMAIAIKTLAKGMIISHNHPSGNKQPSEADRQMTKRLKQAATLFGISLLDHLVVTKDEFYSFADHGDSSLRGLSGKGRGLGAAPKKGDELEYASLSLASEL
jgi:DNA repair protein RadC